MRFTNISRTIGIAAAIVLIGSVAQARPRHSTHDQRYAVPQYGRAHAASPEEFFGRSVPYDPDGPGYNDFQLQGRQ